MLFGGEYVHVDVSTQYVACPELLVRNSVVSGFEPATPCLWVNSLTTQLLAHLNALTFGFVIPDAHLQIY